MSLNRDSRQDLAIDKWVKNKCVGIFEFCTGLVIAVH